MKKTTSREVDLDSMVAMKGQKVSSQPANTGAPVPCHIFTRSGKLASYTIVIADNEVRIMSKKKVKSSIPLDHCHPKIVQKQLRELEVEAADEEK